MALFMAATVTYHLPPQLLPAICFVESSHRVDAIHHDDGGGDSLGICQVKLETAKMLGFKGSKQALMRPEVNIKYAALYLKKQISRYHGDTRKAVAAYNAGVYRPGLSTFAKNHTYVTRVSREWNKRLRQ